MSSPTPRGTDGASTQNEESAVDRRMLDLLVCPQTRGPLDWRPDARELVSRAARLAYPVRDGVSILVASEAREIDEDELAALKPASKGRG